MPGMRGTELAATLRETMPGVAIVLTTGYSNETAQAVVDGLPVVFKPYRPETLSQALDEALGRKPG
jgi:CheY-like chemotaxis protein